MVPKDTQYFPGQAGFLIQHAILPNMKACVSEFFEYFYAKLATFPDHHIHVLISMGRFLDVGCYGFLNISQEIPTGWAHIAFSYDDGFRYLPDRFPRWMLLGSWILGNSYRVGTYRLYISERLAQRSNFPLRLDSALRPIPVHGNRVPFLSLSLT